MEMLERGYTIEINNINYCILKVNFEDNLLLAVELKGACNDKLISIIDIRNKTIIDKFYKIDIALQEFNAISENL